MVKGKSLTSEKEHYNFTYISSEEDRNRTRRKIVATLGSVKSIESIQSYMWDNGLVSIGVKQLGTK